MDCRVCGGDGWLESRPGPCLYCNGTGQERGAAKVTREVPKLSQGDRVRTWGAFGAAYDGAPATFVEVRPEGNKGEVVYRFARHDVAETFGVLRSQLIAGMVRIEVQE